MTAPLLAVLVGLCAAAFGGWVLTRRDARLQDIKLADTGKVNGMRSSRREVGWDLAGLVALCALMLPVELPRLVDIGLSAIASGAVLKRLMTSRTKRALAGQMRSEWPLLLEGMSVAALSGLDLTSAFLSAAKRTGGALRSELDKASIRVAGGMQLSAALRILASDGVYGADRLRALLIQCEVLGTPVAEVLGALAEETSTTERQALEGRFNALPLKMSIITVMFLLPPVLIVSIAPHVLAFLNSNW